jgi:hypothetical protein
VHCIVTSPPFFNVRDYQRPDQLGLVEPTTAELGAWARGSGLIVPDRGRLRPQIWQAWRDAHAAAKDRP